MTARLEAGPASEGPKPAAAAWAVWLPLGLVPWLALRDPILSSIPVSALAGVLWVLGVLQLRAALRDDPTGTRLYALLHGRAGPMALAGMLVGVLTATLWISAGTGGLLALLLGFALLLAWRRSRSAADLGNRLATGLLTAVAGLLCIAVAEAVFRSPPVVLRTGGSFPGGVRWAERNYDRLWETHPLRLRSFHHGPKQPGTIRVVVLGDSFTWGYFVARTENTWPYVAEQRLRELGHQVEFINLAANGASTVDELARLRALGWLFEPDLILLQYTLNDPVTGPYSARFRTIPLIPGLNGFLDRHSYAFSFVNAQWRALQRRIRYPDGENALFTPQAPEWRDSRDALHGIVQHAATLGVPARMVLFPLFVPGPMDSASYRFHPAHHAVLAAADEAGFSAVVDLGPLFWRQAGEGRAWWAVPNDPHPGVEAHGLAGTAVANDLLGWLAPRSEDRIDERSQH